MEISTHHQHNWASVNICAQQHPTECKMCKDISCDGGWSLKIVYRVDSPYHTSVNGFTILRTDKISYTNWIEFISGESVIESKTGHYLHTRSSTDYIFRINNPSKLCPIAFAEIPISILHDPLSEVIEKSRKSGFKFHEEDES